MAADNDAAATAKPPKGRGRSGSTPTKQSPRKPADDFEVDIRPDAAALRMFRSLSFTPWYALGEFVDNSVSSYFQNRKALEIKYGRKYTCDVRITFSDRVGRLVVEDNAAGIARADIRRALRTGEPPPDTSVGLNLHGVGMKAAAFWWGRHLKIETWPLGEANGWAVEIDLGEAGTQPQATAAVHSIAPRKTSGTRITIDGLWQNAPVASKTRATIGAYLPSIYRKFIAVADKEDATSGPLGDHPVRLFLDGAPLSFDPPKLLRSPFWPSPEGPKKNARSVVWRKSISIKLSTGKKIQGWVGILETMSRELSGFTLHYRGKGIGGVTPLDAGRDNNSGFRPRAIFGQAGSYRSQSYIGEFDVTSFGKSITTDSTLWTPDEEEEFIDHVLDALRDPKLDLWSMAVNFKRRKRDKVDKSNLKKASQAAAEQLRAAAAGQISHASPKNDFIEEETAAPEVRFAITDQERHQHSFGLRFSSQRSRPFITLAEDRRRRAHAVVVNESHPLFDDLPPIDKYNRTLLTRIALSLAAAEVFMETPNRSHVRQKMNQVLDLVHPTPDDIPED